MCAGFISLLSAVMFLTKLVLKAEMLALQTTASERKKDIDRVT